MKVIKGDLVQLAKDGKFDVIVHGCNCFCTMGGGIAAQIKKEFPSAYAADLTTRNWTQPKLGNYTSAKIYIGDEILHVVNAYTQFHFGTGRNVNYEAIYTCFEKLKFEFSAKKIGIPMIGAGLAGGNWNIIETIISEVMKNEDITLVKYEA